MKTTYKYFIIALLIVASFTGLSQVTKVLYLGNSHTFWHDLPQLTANLALANGDTIVYEVNAPGGCTLAHPSNGHLFNALSLALIDSMEWDYVVLQEQSLFAVIDYYKNTFTYPGAMVLDSLIKQNHECTRTIMQLIWAKKWGGEHCINSYCTIDFTDFSHMQDSLTAEYLQLSNSLSSMLAPTGEAWRVSIENGDPIDLFDSDGSHPSYAGHYLTACVYYSLMFDNSPVGIPFYGELDQSDAQYFQQIAHDVVFSNPDLWNMYPVIPEAGFSYMQFDNTVHFSDQSVNANDYLWDFGDGSTDSIANPSHTYLTNGSFVVKQRVGNQCNYDWHYDTVNVVITDNSIEEELINEVIVYRDSKTQTIRISSKFKIYSVSVKDISGREISRVSSSGLSEFTLPQCLPNSGVYFLNIETDNGMQSKKVIY